MASVSITRRQTNSGPRYVVRYRLGGRAYPIRHGGSFKTEREAKERVRFVSSEISQGRDPAVALRAFVDGQPIKLTVSRWRDRFLGSRIDLDENTKANYRSALKKLCERYGEQDPHRITAADVAEWVVGLSATHKASTVRLYVIAARLLFDFAKCDPNPARDATVKLPKRVADEPNPVPADHYLAALDALGKKWRLAIVTIEQGGLREDETVQLRWQDVDAASCKLRLPRSATKRDKNRWVTLPRWLMDAIERTCPLEDRVPERRVFQGMSGASLYQAWTRACRNARVPHYTVHDLRDRRGTIWHHVDKLVARELAERLGHSDPWMSLNVYAGAMRVEEASPERLEAVIAS
jgi:integrase